MTRLKTLLALSAFAGGAFVTGPAYAQSTEGAVQLGISSPFLTHTNATLTADYEVAETETEVSQTNWGLGQMFVAEVGYGLTDSLVLGAVLQLAGVSSTTETEAFNQEVDASQLVFILGPKLDYMFAPNNRVRPFLGAVAGLVVDSLDNQVAERSLTGLQLQGRAGLRAFVTEGFSIDPALFLGWTTASGEIESDATSTDLDYSAVSFGVTLGLSGWVL
jgi:hypothetical protein